MEEGLVKAATVEMLATCLFVYFGTGSVVSSGEFLVQSALPDAGTVSRLVPISFAFGMSIMTLVFAIGHISGGHINPAVSFCLMLVGTVSPMRAAFYTLAQLLGAVFGSLLVWGSTSDLSYDRTGARDVLVGDPPFELGANQLNPTLNDGNGFLLEFMGTLLLCLTVLTTVLHHDNLSHGKPNVAAIPIGFAVFLAHIVLVPLTGCGINPARTFGPAVVNSMAGNDTWNSSQWIYYIGPFSASVVAAGLHFTLLRPSQAPVENNDQPKTPEPQEVENVDVEQAMGTIEKS